MNSEEKNYRPQLILGNTTMLEAAIMSILGDSENILSHDNCVLFVTMLDEK